MKKGFTLLELMVVVGIIGILSAILLKAVSGSSDSALAAKCLSNMHNLANACQATSLASGNYPPASSGECLSMDVNLGEGTGMTKTYGETHGWVSWASMGAYRNSPKESKYDESWRISTYEENDEKRLYALTNGAIWKAISANASAYRCPLHEKIAKKHSVSPVWSYVMNSWFAGSDRAVEDMKKLDRRLLFAELPFNTDNTSQKSYVSFSKGTGKTLDPTLQYDDQQEMIGFNHKGKKNWKAHVCFADGHTETLEMPSDASAAKIRELTEWLCECEDISFNGKKYEKMTK